MRIAILGGTFDPVHNGHLAAAQAVAAAFQTDQVLFVPAYSAPHKQGQSTTSAFHRFAMIALAVLPFGDFRPSTIEVDALEKRYTVQTLELLHQQYPGAELIFVLGTDMYQDFETWKDYGQVFTLAHLAVVNRPGFPFRTELAPYREIAAGEQVMPAAATEVFSLPHVVQPISSTAIRKRRREGGDIEAWVPASVCDYIERNALYSA